MTRDQVRFVLGTALVSDIFHQQRWDYVYHYRNGRTGQIDSRRLIVFFDADGRLERLGGDVVQGDAAELAMPANKTRLVELGAISAEEADKPLPPREPPGYFRQMMDMFGF